AIMQDWPTDFSARFGTALDPAIEFVDHRPLGLPSRHGAEQFLDMLRSILDVSADAGFRYDDILGLQANALLTRATQFGTARVGGGVYERPLLVLWIFGPDGLATRSETFAPDCENEALARFDELTAGPAAARPRVRPNAATASTARLDAAISARDADAL